MMGITKSILIVGIASFFIISTECEEQITDQKKGDFDLGLQKVETDNDHGLSLDDGEIGLEEDDHAFLPQLSRVKRQSCYCTSGRCSRCCLRRNRVGQYNCKCC